MDWFKNLLNGYYNVTPPETWEGERKPHWSDDMDSTKVGSYWNYVPPETWSGERKPHFSDDLEPLTNQFFSSILPIENYSNKDLKKDIANERQDPRLWSNLKGMFMGKSKEERIAAHQNLDSTKFRTVYGDKGYSPQNINKKQSTLFDLLNKKEYGTLDIPFGVSRNMKP